MTRLPSAATLMPGSLWRLAISGGLRAALKRARSVIRLTVGVRLSFHGVTRQLVIGALELYDLVL
jgi:hypothetical protein